MESISDGCVGVDSFEFLRQLRGCLGEMEGNHLQTIDVVAGIPSQEGIHFMEKKKKRDANEAVLELKAQYVHMEGRQEY